MTIIGARNGIWPDARVEVLPLTFTAETAGSTITFAYTYGSYVKYRKNYGNWENCNSGTTVTLENQGDCVQYKANGISTGDDEHFSMTGSILGSGSVTSLINGKGGDVPMEGGCNSMFKDCASLKTAPNLDSTILSSFCYYNMFRNCTGLTVAPKLPATTLEDYCYSYLFAGCTNLLEAPELPVTTLAKGCYAGMFYNCNITIAPTLPATTLVDYCYSYMFYDCRYLSEITTYQNSFDGCNLWVKNAGRASGTFRCLSSLGDNDTISRGERACPNGWTVVNINS